MEELTIEELRVKVTELSGQVDALTTEKETLTTELENVKETHKTELDERETTIASLRQYNNELFRKVPQGAFEQKKEEKEEKKEESLADLLSDMMGGK